MNENKPIVVRPDRAYTSSFGAGPPAQPFGGQLPYPGLGDDFFGGPPMNFPQTAPGAGSGLGSLFGSSGGGGSMNLGQLKTIIDRMGGIDGIMGTMTKVQKIVQSFQQMSPMLKLLMGSFLGGAKAQTTRNHDDLDGLPPVSRRRRKSSKSRRPSSGRSTQRRRR